jgi:hypothetical protein
MQRTLAMVTRGALMRAALCIFLLAGLPGAPVFCQPAVSPQEIEQHKIQYLISAVANLKDARFLRNGSEYDAQRAADHLRLKLRYAGGRVKTAEDFIVYCATGSSMSGEKYRIRFADGRLVDSATFLRDKLAAYPAQQDAPHPF